MPVKDEQREEDAINMLMVEQEEGKKINHMINSYLKETYEILIDVQSRFLLIAVFF